MNRHKVRGELVTFKNANAFHHDGILYQKEDFRTTIIHVHGSFGNFYQNEFLRVMAKTYLAAGINFLSFNLAGHDAVTEGYRNEWDFEYVGGALTDFNDCVPDIQAAINFCNDFSDRIILQGHSIGCDRILHYLLASGSKHDFILLSPCDSYQLQADWIKPETVEQQIDRLKKEISDEVKIDWLPIDQYGIRRRDWVYPIYITRKALLSIMSSDAFHLIRMDQPCDFQLKQSAIIYIGDDDALQTSPCEDMFRYFEERIAHVTRLTGYSEGDHSLWGCEQAVADELVKWVQSLPIEHNSKD